MVYLRPLLSGAIFASCLAAGSAFGATLTFDGPNVDPYVEDGFVVDEARIVSGNCESTSGDPCLALNDNETSVVTTVDSSTFTASSFWFQLLGIGTDNTLTVSSSSGGLLDLPVSEFGFNDGGQFFDLSALPDFETFWTGITSLTFASSDGGNVRIDDISVTGDVAPIPLPAAAFGLLAALGLLGAAGARRRA